jgi:predicted nucleic acid-binding protein
MDRVPARRVAIRLLSRPQVPKLDSIRRLAEIESRFAALPVDEAVARAYGELAALTVDPGREVRPRVVDLFIAATARVHDVPLYTKNRKDVEPYAGLIEVRRA